MRPDARHEWPLRLLAVLSLMWAGCASSSGCATKSNKPPTHDKRTPPSADSTTVTPADSAAAPRDQLPDVTYKGGFTKQAGLSTATLEVAGHTRKIELYAPKGLAAKRPLLIAFHGTNDDALKMINYRTYADKLADAEGLLVASPWARHLQSGDWDNHKGSEKYWETHPNTDPDKNPDLLLVRAIIQEARKVYDSDPKRVYTMGHSSGGFFAVAAAMAMPGMIAGFVSNAGGLVRCDTTGGCKFKGSGTSCDAFKSQPGYCACTGTEKPVAIPAAGTGGAVFGYLSHAADDNIVSVYYSCALAARMKAQGHPVSLNVWAEGGHTVPLDLMKRAWPQLKQHALP
jgi:poly(3-hydroxybutyrate) depolymerase